MNVGFDMQLFHQVNLNFDVFKEIRSKIYMQKVNTLPDFIGTGETKIYENSGKMKNVGFDIALDYNKQITKDFFYHLRGHLLMRIIRFWSVTNLRSSCILICPV